MDMCLSLSYCLTVFISLSQVMTRHRTNPGDAEEKRYSCHRVNCVTMDPPHHCVAPKCNCPLACHPKGYQPLLHMIFGVAVPILLSVKMGNFCTKPNRLSDELSESIYLCSLECGHARKYICISLFSLQIYFLKELKRKC